MLIIRQWNMRKSLFGQFVSAPKIRHTCARRRNEKFDLIPDLTFMYWKWIIYMPSDSTRSGTEKPREYKLSFRSRANKQQYPKASTVQSGGITSRPHSLLTECTKNHNDVTFLWTPSNEGVVVKRCFTVLKLLSASRNCHVTNLNTIFIYLERSRELGTNC